MAQQNERDIIRPITIMLDGPTSYHAWSQNMTVFLNGYQSNMTVFLNGYMNKISWLSIFLYQ